MNLRRKRMMLMDGQWYGYLRTASGNPLTLQNAKRLRKLTIYGNAVQDGTPSPDAPVEVQLCGDRTGNLLSMIDANPNTIPVKSYSNGIIEVIGEASLSGGRTNRLSDYITLETNQTYTMVSYLVAGQTDPELYVCLSRREDSTIYKSIEISAEKRFTTIAPDENVEVYLGINLSTKDYNATLRVAIYKGSYTADTLPAYEPYGYKASGRAEGLNLFDTENIIENTEDTTVKIEEYQGKKCLTWTDGSNTSKQHFMQGKFKENTQYTFRFSGYSKNNMQIFIVYTDGSHRGMTIQGGEEWNEIIFQSASGKSIDYWCGWYNHTQKVAIDIDSSMIIEGSYTSETMPPYEPYQPPQDFAVYLPEQIAKVGNVVDKVVVDMEKRTAELRKKVGSVETDCASVVSLNDDGITLQCRNSRLSSGLYQSSEHTEMLNKYFPYIPNSSVDTEGVGPNMAEAMYQTYVRINKSRIDITEEDTLETLADKCQAFLNTLNEPKTYYVLAEPVTSDITSLQQWDAMPNIEGTVSITFDSTIPISNAEAEYHSKEYDAT